MNNFSDLEIRKIIKNHYLQFLERIPNENEIEHHLNEIKKNNISIQELSSIFKNSPEYGDLMDHKRLTQNIGNDFEEIIQNIGGSFENSQKEFQEPDMIFVSCFNEDTDEGGVYIIKENCLEPLFDESGCYGLFYDKKYSILFCLIRKAPQILAFKISKNQISSMTVTFSNYIFGEDAHGCCIYDGNFYLIATEGETNGQNSSNSNTPGKNHVGKIISSEIVFTENSIEIKNSKIINPFECDHHHHINDLIIFNDSLYLCSHSFCNPNKIIIKKGAISKLDSDLKSKVVHERTIHPHSIFAFEKKLFVCSSGLASLFSIDLLKNSTQLEYKGINSYIRGLLVTKSFFYIGMSITKSRSDSKFYNSEAGILQFNRKTGETKRIQIPENCDSVYGITST